MITFKTTEHWDKFVVPRPGIEERVRGGEIRKSFTFLNRLCCIFVFSYSRLDLFVFVHNFYRSPKSAVPNRRHCRVCNFNKGTITHDSKTRDCTYVYESAL